MEIAAISFVCLALGLLVGYEWGERRGKRMRAAAVSALPDYDHELYINQKGVKRGEVVDICGVPMTRM